MFDLAVKMMLTKKVRFIFSTLGIAVAICIMIFILSLYSFPPKGTLEGGIYSDLIISEKGKITIEEQMTGRLDETLRDTLKEIENVKKVSPIIESWSYIVDNGTLINEIPFMLICSQREYSPVVQIIKGEYYAENDTDKILVSKAFADLYQLDINQTLEIIPVLSVYEPPSPAVKVVTIKGIFLNTESVYDSFILGSLQTGKYIKDFDTYVTVFYIEVKDTKKIEETKEKILDACGNKVEVTKVDRKQSVKHIFEESLSTILFFVALFNAAFNSFRNLSTTISEQKKEIGMLKAIGIPKKSITALFLYQGLLISFFGCLTGIVISEILLGKVNEIYSSLLGYPSQFIVLSPVVVFYAFLFPFVVSFLVSLYPAYVVTRTKTITLLRVE